MPEPLLQAICTYCFMQGWFGAFRQRRVWIVLGMYLIVTYAAMLRPGEALRLLRKHVTVPLDAIFNFGCKVLICLVNPKNQLAMGRLQTTVVEDLTATAWIQWWCQDMSAEQPLFAVSGQTLRKYFRRALQCLKIANLGLTFASLRAGRATAHFVGGCPLERLRLLGRWKSSRSLEHYIQEAAASQILATLPPEAVVLVQRLLAPFPSGLRPPVSLRPVWRHHALAGWAPASL